MAYNPNVADQLTGKKKKKSLSDLIGESIQQAPPRPAPTPPSTFQKVVTKAAEYIPKVVGGIFNPVPTLAQTKTAQTFVKEAAQSSARNIVSIGESLTDPNSTGREYTPRSVFSKAIFGTDQPIPQLGRRLDESAADVNKFGTENNLFKPGTDTRLPSYAIAGLGVGFSAIADLLPGSAAESAALKTLAKTDKIEDIYKVLSRFKIAEEKLPKIAEAVRGLTNADEIKAVIREAQPTRFSNLMSKFKLDKQVFKSKLVDAETQLIDRFAPIKRFLSSNKANLTAESDPYIAARNYAGRFGKIQVRLNDLADILQPNKDIMEVGKRYGLLERFQELYSRGITKFPNQLSIDDVNLAKTEIEQELGEVGTAKLQDFLGGLRGYTNKILTEARDAGIISTDAYDSIIKNNEKYLPLQRLQYLDENLDTIQQGSNSFNVPTQDLIKSIKGSEKDIADPIESIVRNTSKAVNLIERNKVATKVADLANLPEFSELVTKLKPNEPLATGMDKISVLRNGVKEEYSVPKELADSLKGLNDANIDIITKTAGFLGSMLRAGATSLNVAFIPANAIRDYQSATLVSKVGFNPLDWARGFTEAFRKGDDFTKFLESGASFSGYFEQNKKLASTVKELTDSTGKKVLKTVTNPFKLLQTIGEKIELAPRIGVFKRSLRKGMTDSEAAFNARNATVDFAKSGSAMKVANLWIPFLNARTQGTINTLTALKDRPIRSAAIIASMVGIPQVATYYNNTKFHKEIWDDIAQYEKDNNFVIIYGDGKDDDGNPTQVVKIPKGDVGRIFGNPLEAFLQYVNDEDPKQIGQIATEMFSNLSPVDFARDGEISPGLAIGGLLPPTIKAGVESTTNTNLFTGRKIVPMGLEKVSPKNQFDDTTSPLAIKLGEWFNISPKLIDNAVGTQFGGLGRQLINPSGFGKQVSKRFSGAKGGEKEQQDFELLNEASQSAADDTVEAKRSATNLLKEIKDLTPEQRKEIIQKKLQNKEIDEDTIKALVGVVEEKVKGLSNFEKAFDNQPNAAKAKFLVEKLDELPMEERKAYFLNLYEKKLISKELVKEIAKQLSEKQ